MAFALLIGMCMPGPVIAAKTLASTPGGAGFAAIPTSSFPSLKIEPSRTSAPGVRITLSTDQMVWNDGYYETDYRISVFPWAFFNESGLLRIQFDDRQMSTLLNGETVTFSGYARNHRQSLRKIAGRAEPIDPRTGNTRVVVVVGGTEIVFRTTYSFLDAPARLPVNSSPAD